MRAGSCKGDGRPAAFAGLESLESRSLLSATVVSPIADVSVKANATPTTITLANNFDDPAISGTVVKFNTSLGNLFVELTDQLTPLTVANFLQYVNGGKYNGTIFHRSVTDFVIQGGGYQPSGTKIDSFSPVNNEPVISNTRGTIAMAKLPAEAPGGGPNSATNEFFFNLKDNAPNLDSQNGGFTAFGKVLFNGMTAVVDPIAALQKTDASNLNSAFDELPVRNYTGGTPQAANMVVMNTVATTPELNFTTSSTNSGLVAPSIVNGQLRLTYGTGKTGTANVTVTATDLQGVQKSDTFTVTVSAAASAPAAAPASTSTTTKTTAKTTSAKSARAGVIRGVVFHDANGDGVKQRGEAGLAGRRVYIDANNNGKLDRKELRARTGPGGGYVFTSLPAGDYRLRVAGQSDWLQSITLGAGDSVSGKNFGLRRA